jgi:hypothetical protein
MHFFDNDQRWGYGFDWYLRHFRPGHGHRWIGEKTPDYLPSLPAHRRMHDLLPNLRLIVLLRNPLDRAYSYWNMLRQESYPWDTDRLGSRSFADALRICLRYPYGDDPILWRGCYADQLANLLQYYPRERVHIAISERVKRDMPGEYGRMFAFLGVEPQADLPYASHHERRKPEQDGEQAGMTGEVRELLHDWYTTHNERLFELLGERIPEWD